jgi:thiamine-phosphate pyrophosphorylase
MDSNRKPILRVLDANFNRLREALRAVEEYYRFAVEDEDACVALKGMRHSAAGMENAVGQDALLEGRDTGGDCFAAVVRSEEADRADIVGVLRANFKRAQEACRVIEEYAKALDGAAGADVSRRAKEMRFALYEMEKTKLK